MALTSAQRTTVTNALTTYATNNPAVRSGGSITAAQFASAQMAILDDYRAQRLPRAHYTLRWKVWAAAKLGLSSTVRTAIDNHVAGN